MRHGQGLCACGLVIQFPIALAEKERSVYAPTEAACLIAEHVAI